MNIQTPEWVKHAIFYQIFPDRFARSPRLKHAPGVTFKPWGSPPEEQGIQGGDLLGIVDKLDYLRDLGVTALYLNPIFSSASNHRYHTFDYFQVDPLLGGNIALRELLDEAHRRGIRVVLDGVFNHASRGFWPFHHILENGRNSPYLDWFIIQDWPLRPYHGNRKRPHNYESWWNLPALPKINIKNPGARAYILNVARYWIDFGIDGWRLDVPEDIKDEDFWRTFRKIVKESNPEAYLCGEIWRYAPEWLQGDKFDGLMNYPFGITVLNFFGANTLRKYRKKNDISLKALNVKEFAKKIKNGLSCYPWDSTQSQLNLLDSHDSPRALWMMGEDKSALKLCFLFLMTMPGAPCIYYGDEIGMTGRDDPYCRAAFPWEDEKKWDKELFSYYQSVVKLRHRFPCLRLGTVTTLYSQDGVYAFGRSHNDQRMVVLFNSKNESVSLNLPVKKITTKNMKFKSIWGKSYSDTGYNGQLRKIMMPARSAVILGNNTEF